MTGWDSVLVGVHHLGLTVPMVEHSARWYEEVLGFSEVGRLGEPDDVTRKIFLRHPDLSIRLGLVQHRDGDRRRFDERQTGLDHLSFAVPNQSELRRWCERLDHLKVAYSPITPARSLRDAEVVVFRDPDNIQLEFIAGAD